MILWKPPKIMKRIIPGLVWDLPTGQPTIYLTFDDGPTPGVTDQVLDILNSHEARATFFCIGRNAERSPEILHAVLDAGHSTGNHTYSHIKGWRTSDRKYLEDIELASRFVPSDLFRPAYGQIRPSQMRYLVKKYRIVMWSLLSFDYHPRLTRERCLDYVVRNTVPGTIVVFHDSVKASGNMLYVLPRMLEHFKRLGYSFSAIPYPERST